MSCKNILVVLLILIRFYSAACTAELLQKSVNSKIQPDSSNADIFNDLLDTSSSIKSLKRNISFDLLEITEKFDKYYTYIYRTTGIFQHSELCKLPKEKKKMLCKYLLTLVLAHDVKEYSMIEPDWKWFKCKKRTITYWVNSSARKAMFMCPKFKGFKEGEEHESDPFYVTAGQEPNSAYILTRCESEKHRTIHAYTWELPFL